MIRRGMAKQRRGSTAACDDGRMQSLTSVIQAAGTGALEAAIFGSTDSSTVAEVMSSIATATTGGSVTSGLWYRSSVAAVAGVTLEGGREVVVRAYQPSAGMAFVEGVVRVQSHLSGEGFACAVPVGEPILIEGVLGRAESMLHDPGPRRFESSEMTKSARGLAQLVALSAGVDPGGLSRHPMALSETRLYPTPHSPVFDFRATTAGAGWIDEIATAARAAMTDTVPVIAHGDWTARNIRLGPGGLVGVYDWESLQDGPESTAVGVAAATWRALGEANEPIAPSAREIALYIDLYERARSAPFSEDQRRSARAAAVYALAYTARCEHALDPGSRTGRAAARLTQDNGLLSLVR